MSIEKEMLVIVVGCERFYDYLYGYYEVVIRSNFEEIYILRILSFIKDDF